jgi:hypothetical protein
MLNIWDANWGLELGLCPCDQHFVEFLEARKLSNSVIYHFGSGGHHLVGVQCMKAGKGNVVISITAAPQEHKEYEKLIIAEPALAHHYICYFSDIYTFDGRLMPMFDIVTLFHLGEFRTAANDAYGAHSEWETLRRFCAQTKTDGLICFYKGSNGWSNTVPLIERAVKEGLIVADGEFKTLPIYRRTAKAA